MAYFLAMSRSARKDNSTMDQSGPATDTNIRLNTAIPLHAFHIMVHSHPIADKESGLEKPVCPATG